LVLWNTASQLLTYRSSLCCIHLSPESHLLYFSSPQSKSRLLSFSGTARPGTSYPLRLFLLVPAQACAATATPSPVASLLCEVWGSHCNESEYLFSGMSDHVPLTLKTEVARFSETSVNIYQTTWRHILE
jgi:hypothetical protein